MLLYYRSLKTHPLRSKKCGVFFYHHMKKITANKFLLLRDFDLLIVNSLLDITGRLSVDTASDGVASTQNLLHRTGEFLCHTAFTHLASDVNNLVQSEVTIVFDVLNLLAITRGLVKRL